MNSKEINIFNKGLSTDLESKADKKQTYKNSLNGRLYSKKGTLSFSSIKGTTEIYNNPAIVKYVGYCSFEDELILIAKYDETFNPNIVQVDETIHSINDITIDYDFADRNTMFNFPQSNDQTKGFDLEEGLLEETITIDKLIKLTPSIEINKDNETCTVEDNYKLQDKFILANINNVPNFFKCDVVLDDVTPKNNEDYSDVIISVKQDAFGAFYFTQLWKGFLNLDINRKLICIGLDENIHYKKVYMTDNLNPFRMFNIKDINLAYRDAKEFDVLQNIELPQPEISEVRTGGSLKVMSVLFVYRLTTEDGLITMFSPASDIIQIYPSDKRAIEDSVIADAFTDEFNNGGSNGELDLDDIVLGGNDYIPPIENTDIAYANGLSTSAGDASNTGESTSGGSNVVSTVGGDSSFRGGDVGERTNKQVVVKIPVYDTSIFTRIECVAIEYEIQGNPTSIKSLGIKKTSDVVTFYHPGSDSNINDFTIAEIVTNNNTWKYCSAMTIAKNKLVVGALRLDPYPINVKSLEDNFLLKGWDENGDTHDCLINPKPTKYKYINPLNTDNYKASLKVLYTKFLSFETFKLKLTNLDNPSKPYIEKEFVNETSSYVDFLNSVYLWLSDPLVDLSIFPNLKVSKSGAYLLFERVDDLTKTDLSLYSFSTKSKQIIVDKDIEYEIEGPDYTGVDLIHGAISYGYNEGTGIRLSWLTEEEVVLEKTEEHSDSGNILGLKRPSLVKSFMKGEIYRFSIQMYKNGNPLFAIPLGDIQAPKLGDNITYIDKQGLGVVTEDKYLNQFVSDDLLYAQRVLLKMEVRIGCELKDFVDSYQLQYVQRTEDNRTILAQGISAPLQRMTSWNRIAESGEDKTPSVFRKWTLPFMGGPLLEKNGFTTYDLKGEDFDDTPDDKGSSRAYQGKKSNVLNRVVSHRGLMYFDSPDLIYDNVGSNKIKTGTLEVLGRLKTDHNRTILKSYRNWAKDDFTFSVFGSFFKGSDYKKSFSKIMPNNLETIIEAEKIPRTWGDAIKKGFGASILFFLTPGYSLIKGHQHRHDTKDTDYSFIRSTVFSTVEPASAIYANPESRFHKVAKSKDAGNGLILPGALFDLSHEVSNNALTLGDPEFYYSNHLRAGGYNNGSNFHQPNYQCEFLKSSNRANGNRTIIIKTDGNLFTDEFLGPEKIEMNCGYHRGETWGKIPVVESHALININLNNENSVYGGRTKYAFSKNVFSPLSAVIRIIDHSNTAQISTVNGDIYTTLYTRTKTSFSNTNDIKKFTMQNGKDSNKHDTHAYNTPSAWMYSVVLETSIEERLSYDYRQYRDEIPVAFNASIKEFINTAYFAKNNLKSFISRPNNFLDNPLLLETVAASKVKIYGSYVDNFLNFPVNDFYELERKDGVISNLTYYDDKLYAIQEKKTSLIVVDPKDVITTDSGAEIQVITGTGKFFSTDKTFSLYGTKIRRAVIETPRGFSFYDELNNEFVFLNEPLSLKHLLQQELIDLYKENPVIDTEGYYDPDKKEVNITLKTKDNKNFTLSYNEVLGVFNGWYSYNSSIYPLLRNKVLAPSNSSENSMHELNKGGYLSIFGNQEIMSITFVVKNDKNLVSIYNSLSASLNTQYNIKKISIFSNLEENNIKVIDENHFRYKIREGVHTVPLRNQTDRSAFRGEWLNVTIELESINNQKVDLFKVITHIRDSKL